MSIRITGMNSGMDTDSMVRELVNAYEKQGQKYTKARTKTEWKQEAWKSLNTKVKSFFTKYASNMRFSDAYKKKSTTVSDSSKATIVASDNAVTGTQTLKVNKLAAAGYLTGAQLNGVSTDTKISDLVEGGISGDTTITINRGAKDGATFDSSKALEITVNENTTVADFVSQVNAISDMTASFDSSNGRIFISSNESGEVNNFSFAGNTGDAGKVLGALGLTGDGAVKLSGKDAQIELNGAIFNSSSNNFSVNGLTITAKAETAEDETLSLVTNTDTDAIYNSIKDFVKEYNSLINELDKLYNAKSASKYEPLTDEEKEAMTDDEIEKWETTIKDSLLRRDTDVDKIASAMRNSMLKSFDITIDGVNKGTYSLASFGIETLGYFNAAENEKNAYHIAGNEDDENSSSGTDKLRSMIASDPEVVEKFFTNLVSGLYDSMNKIQSESNNYTSYGSFYGDKKLQTEYNNQDKQVSKWEDYVADIEEKYYKQFTAMETAMGKLQEQQTSLSQLFS